jgi:penicillin-binding protein 1A
MLGPSSVAQFGYKLGIESAISPNLSLALGTSEVTLLELASVYAVFPNKGKSIKPYGVMEVIDHNGRIVWRVKPKKRVAMSRTSAALITDMLTGVVKEGTGQKARIIKRPVGGKTGTTDKFKDAFFIGFSPSIVTGVWVGQDNFTTLGEWETGSRAALPIWIEFMEKALENKPFQYFDIPDDVVEVYMNSTDGLLENADSPGAVKALFKKGTEPRKYH